jgi:YD repeat-containing protein
MTDTHDSPRLRAPGDARGSSPPPSGTGETPSSSADDVLRSRAAAEPPATPASSEAASAPTPGSSEGGSAAPPAPNAVQRAGTAIDAAVDSAVVATANVPVALPVAQLIDRTVITPFTAIMQGPPPNAGTAGIVRYGIDSIAGVAGVVMGAISLPGQILDTAVASLSSAIMPPGMGFPAACAGTTLHMGMPHSHIPPPAPPVILPSIGDATGPGCLTVMINGMPSLRASDVGFAPTCGSAGVLEIITGSASVFINGKRAARAMDMTRVCNPLGVFSAMAAMSAAMSGLDLAMAALPVVQGIAGAAAEYETMESSTGAEAEAAGMAAIGQGLNAAMMAAQAAADAATNALRATVGVPPAILPPAPVVLGMLSPIPIGRPVLIGGIPVPPLGDMLNHGIAQRRQRMRERRRPTHLDGDGPPHLHPHGGDDADARPRPHPDDDGNQGHCREGHPVDSVTGAVFDDYIDYRSAGLFHWRRTYNSQLAVADGPVGRGFRHDYAVTLRALLHRCTYTDVFGRETRFPRFDPEMNQVSALGWLLTRESPSRYRLERKGQPTRIFQLRAYSRTARLTTVSLGARSLELEYDRNDRLAHVTESVEGRRETRYLFEYDREGHIVGLMLEGGTRALVEHGYDRTGHLIRVRRLDGSSMQYGYDVGHRMTEWTDPTGYVFKWSYDAEGRCVWTTGVDGLLSRRLAYTARTTTVTASDDGVWTHHHRADGLLTKKEDPARRSAGAIGRWPRARSRRDRQWWADHRAALRRARAHRRAARFTGAGCYRLPPRTPLLPRLSCRCRARSSRDTSAPFRGAEWTDPHIHHRPPRDTAAWAVRPVPPISPKRAFDHLRNVVESIDDRGSRRTFRYDGAGELIEFRDGDGATWGFRTHRWKLLAQETNPLGHTTRYRYDNEGNLSMVIDPLVAMTEYAYDQKGRLTQVRRHGATQHEYAYDAADRLVERRNGAGTPELRVLAYDRSRPTRIEVASGATHELTYDGRGRVRTADVIEEGRRISLDCARDGAARVTRDERDGAGLRRRFLHDGSTELVLFDRFRFVTRPTEDGGFLILGPTGTLEVARMREHSVLERQLGSGSYDLQQFDSSGRLIGHVLHRVLPGRTTDVWGARYDRSAEGDLTSVWDSGRGGARYTYDAAHRLETYDRADTTQRYEYDPANNILAKPGLARAEYAEGNRLSETEEEVFLHDESQRLTARRRRRDGLFTRYHYDAEGQLRRVETRDGSGVSTCDDWTADYDALGRRVRFGRGGAKTELHWDGFRLAGETSPSGAAAALRLSGRRLVHPVRVHRLRVTRGTAGVGLDVLRASPRVRAAPDDRGLPRTHRLVGLRRRALR